MAPVSGTTATYPATVSAAGCSMASSVGGPRGRPPAPGRAAGGRPGSVSQPSLDDVEQGSGDLGLGAAIDLRDDAGRIEHGHRVVLGAHADAGTGDVV